MILARVHHYLNEEGLLYFPVWFDELYVVIKDQEGFIDIAYRVDKDLSYVIISVLFSSAEMLTQWAKTPEHHLVISKLDDFRTRPWASEKYLVGETQQ